MLNKQQGKKTIGGMTKLKTGQNFSDPYNSNVQTQPLYKRKEDLYA